MLSTRFIRALLLSIVVKGTSFFEATLLARSTAQQAREAQLLRELEAVKAATLKQEQDFDAEGRPPLISARYYL